MKVDMSPEAVTARLRELDELWLLSVKLMNSKKIKSATEIELSDKERDARSHRKELR